MPKKPQRSRAADFARPTIASLGLRVTLVPHEDDTELRALIERYERLTAEWEALSHRALTLIARRSRASAEAYNAVHRS
ncbi:hypothetical protein DK412_14665 [Methylobacterium sp. 17Sr1-1]|nr:hypothetical protein DK412_14665 [Methylobacterium sp. 17Sr1-1]